MKKIKLLLSFTLPVVAVLCIAATQTWRNIDATGTFRGTIISTATTNQLTFGATNATPSNPTTIVHWVSVTVTNRTNIYRLPLYQ